MATATRARRSSRVGVVDRTALMPRAAGVPSCWPPAHRTGVPTRPAACYSEGAPRGPARTGPTMEVSPCAVRPDGGHVSQGAPADAGRERIAERWWWVVAPAAV